MRAQALALVLAIGVAGTAHAGEAPSGAIFAERPLPDGAVAMFAVLGYPSVGVGYRQGLGGVELGGVASFDYALTQLNLDAPFRFTLAESRRFRVGAGISPGAFFDLGATYIEPTNLSSAGLRVAATTDVSVLVTEGFHFIGSLAVPAEIALTERGNHRIAFLLGAGVEVGVGDGYSIGAQVLAGPELLHPRGGQSGGRLSISALAGIGKRFF
jgi:hypothetical protein